MNRFRNVFLLTLLALLFGSALPLLAQDAAPTQAISIVPIGIDAIVTEEAAATAVAVPGDSGVVINIEQADPGTSEGTDAPPPAPPFSSQDFFMAVLAIVVIFEKYTNGGIVKTVAAIFKMSEERTRELYEMGVKAGIQQQIIAALKTPDKTDDEKAYQLAKDGGYRVVFLADGTPALEKLPATAAGRSLIQEATA